MFRLGLTTAISAFLLFQIQPMFARQILPRFGGASLVWTSCLVFFQLVLVGGYLYAHLITTYIRPVFQVGIHLALILLAFYWLPISPGDSTVPEMGMDASLAVAGLLWASLGLPVLLLSATSPLIQFWCSNIHRHQSPYRLYSMSNVGSLLALLSYPFLFEPNFNLADQSRMWATGFVVFGALTIWCGATFVRCDSQDINLFGDYAHPSDVTWMSEGFPNRCLRLAMWGLLPMVASILLIAVTNLITHEVAAVPLLWVIPLCLYLLSFIISFDHPRWYSRPLVWPIMWTSVLASAYLSIYATDTPITIQLFCFCGMLFLTSFACHGELVQWRPHKSGLTSFYLMIGVGGALGGFCISTLAPILLDDFYEFHFGMLLAVVLTFISFVGQRILSNPLSKVGNPDSDPTLNQSRDTAPSLAPIRRTGFFPVLSHLFRQKTMVFSGCMTLIVAAVVLHAALESATTWHADDATLVSKTRNAYGVLQVVEIQRDSPYRILVDGEIMHGMQFIDSYRRKIPIAYYERSNCFGSLLKYLRSKHGDAGLQIGVAGLGAGTIAAYVAAKDELVFYEINPAIIEVAEEQFTYVHDARNRGAKIDLALGDARLQLRDRKNSDGELFDLLVIDAFSSDSIPTHLLTVEGFELYKSCLKPEGILAVQISNRFLSLESVAFMSAAGVRWPATLLEAGDRENDRRTGCTWVVCSEDASLHSDSLILSDKVPYSVDDDPVTWTDDFTSITPLIDWSDFRLPTILWQVAGGTAR